MSPRKQPKPWPKYTRNLKTPLAYDGDLIDEVECRLDAICTLYQIDQQDSSWEQRLLMTLLHRHVPGFRFIKPRRTKIDEAFLIETVDALKSHHEKTSGRKPSTEAVAQEIADTPPETNPFHGMSAARIKRVYTGRRKREQQQEVEHRELSEQLVGTLKAQMALAECPADVPSRLLMDALRQRYR